MTVKSRIIGSVISAVALVLVAFGLLIYYTTTEAERTKLDARLESHADKLVAEFGENSNEDNFPDIPALLEIRTEGLPQPRIRLIDSTDSILYADTNLVRSPGRSWTDILARQAIYENILVGQIRSRSLWIPVEIDDQFRYALQVVVPLTEVESASARLQWLLVLIIPVSLILSGLAIYSIVRSSLRPITSMIDTARSISASDLSKRVALRDGTDEVHVLGAALNTMIDRIDAAFRSQKQFIADASHEIRTPLTIIRSEVEYAERRIRDAKAKESLKIVLGELDRLKQLTDDLLFLARLDSSKATLQHQSINCSELVSDCVHRMRLQNKRRRIILEQKVNQRLTVVGSAEQLRSVFLNLIDNAIKYSKPRTRVTVSVIRQEQTAIIAVRDDGEGIPDVEIPNIFERFHRGVIARSEESGSGLGLAIAAQIVELHAGTIEVRSQIGKGSTFAVRLPLGDVPAT